MRFRPVDVIALLLIALFILAAAKAAKSLALLAALSNFPAI
jgi:hypothetical protein